jgi:hypothetical protein
MSGNVKGRSWRPPRPVSAPYDGHSSPARPLSVPVVCPTRSLIEVDFDQVTFCDCSGLNVLLGARVTFLESRASTRLETVPPTVVRAHEPVTRLFHLTGVGRLFGMGVAPFKGGPYLRELRLGVRPGDRTGSPGGHRRDP